MGDPVEPAGEDAPMPRARILAPFREPDFRKWAFGLAITMIGDGFFLIAMAWQVYLLSNLPTALGTVGLALTVPTVLTLLGGGVLVDRYDRRYVVVAADLIRFVPIALIGVLAITGRLELWHMIVLVIPVGIGNALYQPAGTAMLSDLVKPDLLPSANAAMVLIRSVSVRMVGPGLGGIVVAAVGPGPAFLVDAATFIVSAVATASIRPLTAASAKTSESVVDALLAGIRFAKSTRWLWASLLAGMVSGLFWWGPIEVLLPYLVKNNLRLGPEALGLILGAGAAGSIVSAVLMGQARRPRRFMTVMYLGWIGGLFVLAGYGVMTALWQGIVVTIIAYGLTEMSLILWSTLLQTEVPRQMLGRVASLDWLLSNATAPMSFALTGPIAERFGATATMTVGLVLAAAITALIFLVPGVRDLERREMARVAAGESSP